MESPDLQTKYQKLAAEYARLRAQIPVLKKGVVDEQAKCEALKTDLKHRDQKVRKFEQEVDSLTFRNDQLTKRAAILQQELDGSSKHHKQKGKRESSVWHTHHNDDAPVMPSETERVLSEELQSKIEENARLHKEIYDVTVKHNEAMIVLQNEVARCEKESGEHSKALESLSAAFKSQVDALIEEKAMLEVKLLTMDNQSKQLKSRADSAEMQLCNISQELSLGLTSSTSQDDVSRSVSVQSFSATPDPDDSSDICQLVNEAVTFGKQVVRSLSNFYAYSDQRLVNYPKSLTDANAQILSKAADYIKPLELALKSLHEHSGSKNIHINDLTSSFSRFCDYHNDVTVFLVQTLQKESSDSDSSLVQANRELIKAFEQFLIGLKQTSDSLNKLSIVLKSNRDSPLLEKPYREVISSLQSTLESSRDMSRYFNTKVSLEQSLDASAKFKTANECVVSCTISLVTVMEKLTSHLRANLDTIAKPCFSSNSPASMKSSDSLDLSIITQQVANLKEKLLNLESEREHWMLESQLLQVKLDEKCKLVQDLEKQACTSDDVEENIIQQADSVSRDSSDNSPYLDLSMLGSKTELSADRLSQSGDVTLREKLIKQYYSSRLADLKSKLHLSDSKCVNFYHETNALHNRLKAIEKAKCRVEAQLDLGIKDVRDLKEELNTTSTRYEDQMNLMSEHIAQLNDQLAAHKEEIDTLKLALKAKK